MAASFSSSSSFVIFFRFFFLEGSSFKFIRAPEETESNVQEPRSHVSQ